MRAFCISFLIVASGFSFASCGKSSPKQTDTSRIGWVKTAPTQSSELGVLVSGVSRHWVENWVSAQAGRGARDLSVPILREKTGKFELYGESFDEIQKSLHASSEDTSEVSFKKGIPFKLRKNFFVSLPSFDYSLFREKPTENGNVGGPVFIHKEILQVAKAHHFSKGKGINIAVIDTGVNFEHPDLQGKEMESVSGYDFIEGDADPSDDNMHGTAAAGLIAGEHSGIDPIAKILAIRAFGKNGMADVGSVEAGLDYAVSTGVDIINASFGYDRKTLEMEEAIKRAEEKEVLVVASSGNEGKNVDIFKNYPATFPFKNIISVGALDFNGKLSNYSNFGIKNVHIAAPVGDERNGILTTSFSSEFGLYLEFGGTSAAAPLVAGVAALAQSQFKFKTAETLREHIFKSGIQIPTLRGKLLHPIRVDALRVFESEN